MLEARLYLNQPIQEIFEVAEMLSAAADAHLAGERHQAAHLLRRADSLQVRMFVDAAWGRGAKARYAFLRLADAPRHLKLVERPSPRMPTTAVKQAVRLRDRLHCRFCGIPLIDPVIRKMLMLNYPNEVRWSPIDSVKHAGLMCLWLQYDHVLPNSRGGESSLDNVVLTCSACNFGRMEATLEEARLVHPLVAERPKWKLYEIWDGLERLRQSTAHLDHA